MVTIDIKSSTIIQRMINELLQAKAENKNTTKMMKHIENVHLLSDLILTDTSLTKNVLTQPTAPSSEISEQEMKAMILGKQTQDKQAQANSVYDDDEDNGDSLFDF